MSAWGIEAAKIAREATGNDSSLLPQWRAYNSVVESQASWPTEGCSPEAHFAGRAYHPPRAITRDITDTAPTPISPVSPGEWETPPNGHLTAHCSRLIGCNGGPLVSGAEAGRMQVRRVSYRGPLTTSAIKLTDKHTGYDWDPVLAWVNRGIGFVPAENTPPSLPPPPPPPNTRPERRYKKYSCKTGASFVSNFWKGIHSNVSLARSKCSIRVWHFCPGPPWAHPRCSKIHKAGMKEAFIPLWLEFRARLLLGCRFHLRCTIRSHSVNKRVLPWL